MIYVEKKKANICFAFLLIKKYNLKLAESYSTIYMLEGSVTTDSEILKTIPKNIHHHTITSGFYA